MKKEIIIPKEELKSELPEELAIKYNCSIREIQKQIKETTFQFSYNIIEHREMKCPYCGKYFTSWPSVRGHISNCSLNTHEYYVHNVIGLIHYTDINKFERADDLRFFFPNSGLTTLEQLKRAFKHIPSIKWPSSHRWTKELITKRLAHFIEENKRVPTKSELTNHPYYPSYTTISKYFGSVIIAFREIIPDYNPIHSDKFGNPTRALDGVLYRSNFEARFVNKFLYQKEEYLYEVPYNGFPYRYDFFLPKKDLYIEVAGLNGLNSYDKTLSRKIIINQKQNRKLIVVTKDNIDKITLE